MREIYSSISSHTLMSILHVNFTDYFKVSRSPLRKHVLHIMLSISKCKRCKKYLCSTRALYTYCSQHTEITPFTKLTHQHEIYRE